MHCKIQSFAFCVLAYNHEKYIVEHLESIKYLIEVHGAGIDFQIIVNDDCSTDKTLLLINLWLEKHRELFADIIKIYNINNIGTCSSLKNILNRVTASHCKITAGDDVYSFEDIFKSASSLGHNDILSGIPLSLVDGNLTKNNFDVFNVVASDVIYKTSALINRFKEISVNNAPNIIYKKEHLKNEKIVNFFSRYDVVEDWPLQIAIAESKEFPKFYLDSVVFVYYRRTSGSAFIVASDRFVKDQTNIFEYLIRNETSLIKKLILKNRLLCFISDSTFVKRFLNSAKWIYAIRISINIFPILKRMNDLNLDASKHRKHYHEIQNRSKKFYLETNSYDYNF